ncbi:MAG: EcsC family protein [Myxococcales bacterium]|nr:EcsC family protein [Myxococcales bacterium]
MSRGIRSVFQDSQGLARRRLRDLIAQERERAQLHIDIVKRSEPGISQDRLARLLLERWTKVAKVEGGLTGMLGLVGVPLNLMLFAYCQLAVMVSIAEAYGIELRGHSGEEALVDVLGRVHGIEDVIRSSPRVLGVLARSLALRHGLGVFGRVIPLLAVPVSVHLNAREMEKVGHAAMRHFGNVIFLA